MSLTLILHENRLLSDIEINCVPLGNDSRETKSVDRQSGIIELRHETWVYEQFRHKTASTVTGNG